MYFNINKDLNRFSRYIYVAKLFLISNVIIMYEFVIRWYCWNGLVMISNCYFVCWDCLLFVIFIELSRGSFCLVLLLYCLSIIIIQSSVLLLLLLLSWKNTSKNRSDVVIQSVCVYESTSRILWIKNQLKKRKSVMIYER